MEPGFGFRPSVVWDRPDRFAEFMMGRGVSVKRKKEWNEIASYAMISYDI